jgi:hypothetical protein
MDALVRFLELVQRELQADDVRFEVAVQPPSEPLVHTLESGFRIVVVGARAPADADERKRRLEVLADAFTETLEAAAAQAPTPHMPATSLANHALDETLASLARVAHAFAAIVVDERSPVIWGSSLAPRGAEDADVAAWVSAAAHSATRGGLDLAELMGADAKRRDELIGGLGAEDQARVHRAIVRLDSLAHLDSPASRRGFVLAMRAIAAARRGPADARVGISETDPLGWLARGFAGIYRLVLVFDGPFSELHAEAATIRALPVIERIVTGLPPFDGPKGGQVVRLFPPK